MLAPRLLDDDAHAASAHGPRSMLAALVDRRVLMLSAIYLLIQMSVYGVIFYLPQQVAALLGTTVGLRRSASSPPCRGCARCS